VTIHIPSEWAEYERVQLEFDSTGESMVYSTDGFPLHGLTGGYGGDRRVEFIIPEAQRKAGVAHYFIEATCNKLGGQNDIHAPDDNQYYRLNSADLVVPNMEAWRLMWDFNTLKGLLDALPGDTPLAMRCQYVANEIMNIFVPTDPDSIKKARKAAETILGENWETMMEDDSQKAENQQGTLWGIGHWYVIHHNFGPTHDVPLMCSHIDTAWLWPFSVTQQKSARSWSTQLDLMNRYPEHRFSATQAQQFKWLEQLYPELFDKLKERVTEGKFQPLGATWVEMDVNMPSGESLVRQFLYGQRYFESRFGFRSDTFVLPDTCKLLLVRPS
jgi:alpha-mannosidase